MRFDKNRCMQCDNPTRGANFYSDFNEGWVSESGDYLNTGYWFCHRRCFEKTLNSFILPRYHTDATYQNDPTVKHVAAREIQWEPNEMLARHTVESEIRDWKRIRIDWVRAAQRRLSAEINAFEQEEESKRQLQLDKDRAKLEAERVKEQGKLDAERQKQATKFEAERAEREAFEQKLKPRPIPEGLRTQHTHILAPSGYGKTTLIQQIILDDLEKPDPPGYIVIDPKGELVDRIARLAVFSPARGRLADRLVVIDPTDDELPALNMFSMPNVTDAKVKQRVLNQLIETLAYVFSSADSPLTQRQSIPFSFVVKLVFFMGGDINTLMDVLEDTKEKRRFANEIEAFCATDRGAKRFFDHDFYETPFKATRDQIRTRIYEIISRPELMSMLAAKVNNISLFDCIQHGKIVLVNTARPLGAEASTILGRYMIALTINAAFSRYAVPKNEWRPAYLVIDEFQDFIDEEKTPEMLRLAREYNLGIVVAHQNMYSGELSELLRNSISTNTTIKYCAGSEGLDRSYMARDLRCEQEFITAYTEPKDEHGHFACYARGMGLSHPFIYSVPYGNIQARPQMDEASYRHMRANNQTRLAEKTPAPMQSAPMAIPVARPPAIRSSTPTVNTSDPGEPSDKW